METEETVYKLSDDLKDKLERYFVNQGLPPQVMEIVNELIFQEQVCTYKPNDWHGGPEARLIELLDMSDRLGDHLTWLSGLMDGMKEGPGCLGECPIFRKKQNEGRFLIDWKN